MHFRTMPVASIKPKVRRILKISDIDFTSPSAKRAKVSSSSRHSSGTSTLPSVTPPSASEQGDFFKEMSAISKPALLSIIPEYCEAYVPSRPAGFPPLLSDLFEESMLDVSYSTLLVDVPLPGTGNTGQGRSDRPSDGSRRCQ